MHVIICVYLFKNRDKEHDVIMKKKKAKVTMSKLNRNGGSNAGLKRYSHSLLWFLSLLTVISSVV